MNIKEIAKLTGKTERSIRLWIGKASENNSGLTSNVALKPVKDDKEETMREIKESVRNIDNALRIQERRGNQEAAWIRKHL